MVWVDPEDSGGLGIVPARLLDRALDERLFRLSDAVVECGDRLPCQCRFLQD